MILVAALAACGAREEPAADPRALAADARTLTTLVAADDVLGALDEVDRALDEDRPYLAEERLRVAAIPAARRMVDRARVLSVTSPDGERLRSALERAYRDRAQALERHRELLASGRDESYDHVEVIEAERAASQAIARTAEAIADLRLAHP